MKAIILATAFAALLSACWDDDSAPPAAAAPAGVIDRFEVVSTADAYNGATPAGAAGPYSVITGIVHGKLNPTHPDNAGIVDLAGAPVGADGYVSYSTDVVILRPKSAANARRVLFYDVVNRGSKVALGFIGGGAITGGAAPDATVPSILRLGYTIVWSGWQSEIAQSGAGATGAIGVSFPVATNSDGSPITGLSREEYVPDFAGGTTIPLTYLPASMTDRSEVTFTARQTWLNANGKEDYASPSAPVSTWNYVTNPDGSVSVQFTPPAAVPTPSGATVPADAGTIYTFIYRAKNPKVSGIGFAAVRDLISFLRNASADAQGTANPLNDLDGRAMAAVFQLDPPGEPMTAKPDAALGEGVSQSGPLHARLPLSGIQQGSQRQQGLRRDDADHSGQPKDVGQLPLQPRRALVQATRGSLDAGRPVSLRLQRDHRPGERCERWSVQELPGFEHLPECHADRWRL